jgi:hypothetical protein
MAVLTVTVIIVLVPGAVAVTYFQWRSSQKAGLTGVCTVDYYFEADVVPVQAVTVTTTIGNMTAHYTESSTVGTPTPTLTASGTFTTEAPFNVTAYTLTTTSTGLSGLNLVWNVTICTFTH